MDYWGRKLMREQLDNRLAVLKNYANSDSPKRGWIKTIREALGISSIQLGKKAGMDQSRVSRLENAEKNGNLKLSSMQKIAKGLNMKFVYGFVAQGSLEQMVQKQAERKALIKLHRLNETMRLEKQGLSDEQQKKALEDMVKKILIDSPKDFWD